MKLYIYDLENKIIAVITGDSNKACEAKASELNYDSDGDLGWTYAPAFGTNDSLTWGDNVQEYDAESEED